MYLNRPSLKWITGAVGLLVLYRGVVLASRVHANTLLAQAVDAGDAATISILVERGADPNRRDVGGLTPLMTAIVARNPEVVSALLEAGADPNQPDDTGITPVLRAARGGEGGFLRLLIQKGAIVAPRDSRGHAVMVEAARSGRPDAISVLLRHHIPADTPPPRTTPLLALAGAGIPPMSPMAPSYLSLSGRSVLPVGLRGQSVPAALRVQSAELLLKAGADLERRDHLGRTPLLAAAASGQYELMSKFMDHGANPAARDSRGASALDVALAYGDFRLAALIYRRYPSAPPSERLAAAAWLGDTTGAASALAAGARPDGDHRRPSPLILALAAGRIGVARLLLAHGASPNGSVADPLRPLSAAVYATDLSGFELLLHSGVRRDERSRNGRSALVEAADLGRSGVARRLLEYGVDRNLVGRSGETPLSAAAAHEGAEAEQTVDVLLAAGADPNGSAGSPPLLAAVRAGELSVIERLVASGARADLRDRSGQTPLHAAAIAGNVAAVKLLLQLTPAPSSTDAGGDTPLHAAVQLRDPEIATLLLAAGARCDPPDHSGATPLHLAISAGNPVSARALLDRGANPNVRTLDGRTPLSLACRMSDAALVRSLLEHRADPNLRGPFNMTPLALMERRRWRGHDVPAIRRLLEKAGGRM